MGGVLLLISYKGAKKEVLEYIIPIWEVTGTFGAFWVVVSDFAYPSILIPAAYIFAVPLMLFLILIVARNSSIVFGEYILKKGWLDEQKLYLLYSLSTIILGLIVLVILSSIIGGAGIDLAGGKFLILGWLSSPGNILFIAGTLLITIGLAPVFYNLKAFSFLSVPSTASGVAISVFSFYLLAPALMSPFLVIPIVLTLAVPVLYHTRIGQTLVTNKLVFISLASVIIFTLNPLVYPYAFGKALGVDSLTTSGPMAGAYLLITVIGCILLGIMLAIYLLAVRRSYASKATLIHQ